jgi:hypothetical protein
MVTGLLCDDARWVEDDKNNTCESWNLMWTWSSNISVNHSNLLVWQRINHYPRIKVRNASSTKIIGHALSSLLLLRNLHGKIYSNDTWKDVNVFMEEADLR